MIKIDQSEEFSQFAVSGGLREILHGLDFVWQWTNTFTGDVVSKEIQGRDPKQALGYVD